MGASHASTRVVHLSSFESNGGAARAAWRVHESLRQDGGVVSTMFVGNRGDRNPGVEQYTHGTGVRGRLERYVRREVKRRQLEGAARTRPLQFEPFQIDRTEYGSDVAHAAPPADIYHLHQITDFLDYRKIGRAHV